DRLVARSLQRPVLPLATQVDAGFRLPRPCGLVRLIRSALRLWRWPTGLGCPASAGYCWAGSCWEYGLAVWLKRSSIAPSPTSQSTVVTSRPGQVYAVASLPP